MERILQRNYYEVFNKEPQWVEYCSASFNLVGSEVDYVGGKIIKLVTHKGVWVLASFREDRNVKVYSVNTQKILNFSLDNLEFDESDSYSNHFRGVYAILELEGVPFDQGLDILVYSDIPMGWRFANIAPLETALCILVNKAYQIGLTQRQLVFLAHEVGNCYVDIRKGTVHYLPLTQKDAGKLVIYDHSSSIYSINPIQKKEARILIISPKEVTEYDSDLYRQRHKSYQNIYRYLKYNRGYYLKKLAQIDRKMLPRVIEELNNPKMGRIMEHLVSEGERIQEILDTTCWSVIGKKMIESQLSLNFNYDKYEVELEEIIDVFRHASGVLGYRYTLDNHIIVMVNQKDEKGLLLHMMSNPKLKDYNIASI